MFNRRHLQISRDYLQSSDSTEEMKGLKDERFKGLKRVKGNEGLKYERGC